MIFQDCFYIQVLVDFDVYFGRSNDVQASASLQMAWRFSPEISWCSTDSILLLLFSHGRGSKAAPEHHRATTMLHCREGILFMYTSVFLLQTYQQSIDLKSSSVISSLHRTESPVFCSLIWFWAYWSRLFFCVTSVAAPLICVLLCKPKPRCLLPPSLAAG